jgi:hypothetical protein
MTFEPNPSFSPTDQVAPDAPKKKRPWRVARIGLTESHVYASPKRRCECGTCPFCIESARWDRIFQEKFADPTYYSKTPPRHASSLHGW